MMIRLLLLLLCLCSTVTAKAESVQPHWDMLEDQGFELQEARNPTLDWKESKWAAPNLGFTSKAYWFRYHFKGSDLGDGRWYLWIHNALLASVDFHLMENGREISSQRAGINYGHFGSTTGSYQPAFDFVVHADMNYEILLKVYSDTALQVPAELVSESHFLTRKEKSDNLLGVFLGILLAMLLYNFVLYLTVKDKTFLLYVGHASCFMFFVTSWQGIGAKFIWPGQVEIQQYSTAMSTFLTIGFSMWFCGEFLKIRKWNFSGCQAFWAVRNIALVGCVLTPFMDVQWGIMVSSALSFPAVVLVLQAMWALASFKYRPTRLFVIGWLMYVCGAFSMGLNKFGLVEVVGATENMVLWGAVSDMILLCIALGDKFNEERKIKMRAQERAIEAVQQETEVRQLTLDKEVKARQAMLDAVNAQDNYARMLEKKVEERTRDLQEALTDLEQLSEVDALTQLKNRRYFHERLAQEIEKSKRLNLTFSLLMMDIDHFKSINDSYGHIVGDECICKVARLLQRYLRRSDDLVCRYGGEEFVALLPNCGEEQALALGEELRARIAQYPLACGNEHIMVTLSVGVHVVTPDSLPLVLEEQSQDDLVNGADRALYEAKNRGRNCVCLAG